MRAVEPKEEKALPFPVKRIATSAVGALLASGKRFTLRGITLYTKPTEDLEVGFLIRRLAGKAVERNRTRRLFWGLINNGLLAPGKKQSYLFLFHHKFDTSDRLLPVIQQLIGLACEPR